MKIWEDLRKFLAENPYPGITLAVGILGFWMGLGSVLVFGAGLGDGAWWGGFLQNFATEMLGILFTLVVLGAIQAANDRRIREEQEQANRNVQQLTMILFLRQAETKEHKHSIIHEMKRYDLLRGADMYSLNLQDIQVPGADLRHTNFQGSNLSGANLASTDMERATLNWSVLEGADLHSANMQSAQLNKANLKLARMPNTNLRNAKLAKADLRNAWMKKTNLRDANMRGAVLEYAELLWADLRGADLGFADFRHANMESADLRGSYLCAANFEGADIGYADFSGANLAGADLSGALLIEKAHFSTSTILPDSAFKIGRNGRLAIDSKRKFVFEKPKYWNPQIDMTQYTYTEHPQYIHVSLPADE